MKSIKFLTPISRFNVTNSIVNYMKYATFAVMTISASFLSAQDKYIAVKATADTLLLGNICEITFSAYNISSKFEAPDFSEVPVISGPNVASNMQFVNGHMTQSQSYTYVVKPEETGVFFIGAAYFTSQDTTYETPPFEMIVVPNPGQKKQDLKKSKVIYRSDIELQQKPDTPVGKKRKKIKL